MTLPSPSFSYSISPGQTAPKWFGGAKGRTCTQKWAKQALQLETGYLSSVFPDPCYVGRNQLSPRAPAHRWNAPG